MNLSLHVHVFVRTEKELFIFAFLLLFRNWKTNMCLFLLTLNNKGPVIGGSYCHDKFLLAESNFTISGLVEKYCEPRKSLTSKPQTVQKVFRGTPYTLSLYFPLPSLISNHQTDLQLQTLP